MTINAENIWLIIQYAENAIYCFDAYVKIKDTMLELM